VCDLARADALTQAELVRRREVTPIELVDSAIERIERINGVLNAVVTRTFERARETALALAPADLPLAGVPLLLKDLLATYAGARQTEGSRFLRDHVPDRDSTLVSRFKRAGLIVLGKTNTPEFGNASTTEPLFLGPCRNPWDRSRTTGGSSGGSAAAVAAGMVPLGHGSDGGGSIRVPAACCGLFGLKPTRGRTPLGPSFGDVFAGLYTEHVLTRSVRDSAAVLDVTAGPEAGDPHVVPDLDGSFLGQVGADPGRLRIGYSLEHPRGVDLHPHVRAAVIEAAQICSNLGHEVEPAAPSFDAEILEAGFFELWADGTAWLVDRWIARVGRGPKRDELEPLTWLLCDIGRGRSAADHLATVERLQRQARRVATFFGQFDVWLTPTVSEPPVPLGTFVSTDGAPEAALELDGRFSPFTFVANVTGQPAASIPLMWNDDELPIGVHLVGKFGDEATLFRLSSQLESAQPWRHRVPPVWAGA
jgi:amidase